MRYEQVKDLRIFQQAEILSDEIWNEVIKLDYFSKRTVGEQLVRAIDSIGSNIAEGYGRHHLKEAINFYYYSRGSLEEARYWIKRLLKRKILPEQKCVKWLEELKNLAPQINTFISKKQRDIQK